MTGRPKHRHYKFLIELLYNQADYIDRLPELTFIIAPNQYMIHNNITKIDALKDILADLEALGYITKYNFKYGRLTCQIAKPLI